MQLTKIARLHKETRRPRSSRIYWSQALQGGWFRLSKKSAIVSAARDGWLMVSLAAAKRASRLGSGAWREVVYNALRRDVFLAD
ncbi:MAG: hypothetical protein JNM27_05505 [Leptospirales bacterium]|nr:hypothetical protein [Leptospirales bacterium]